jgi:tRNA uridine 5-carboxymethylaminomethyl modification enzyme
MTYEILGELDSARPTLPPRVLTTVEVTVKYEGYVKRQIAEVERHAKLELKALPADLDYMQIKGLRIEAAQKLDKFKPLTIGQASRISGVNPADISVLLIYLGLK